MRLGVGLPTTTPGAGRDLILDWARQADESPFSTLGVFDRFAYDSYDPLVSLAAAAAVTKRVRLATTILTAPLYNTALLAKAAASLDALSGGRLILALGIGARQSDYEAAGVDHRNRGGRLAEQTLVLRSAWEENHIGPKPIQEGGPKLLLGGLSDAVFARMARSAHGYIHGGGAPRAFSRAAEKARAAWTDAGRPDHFHLWGMGYYALGEKGVEAGRRYMNDYYAFAGPFAEKIAAGLLTSPEAVREFVAGYRDAGCEDLVLFPTSSDLGQLAGLADAVSGLDISTDPTVSQEKRS